MRGPDEDQTFRLNEPEGETRVLALLGQSVGSTTESRDLRHRLRCCGRQWKIKWNTRSVINEYWRNTMTETDGHNSDL